MIARGWIWLFLAAALGAQERCYVQVDAVEQAFVQQPVVVSVTIGWDRAWFEQHGVALIRQPTDAPVHVDLPWLRAAPERAVTFSPVGDDELAATVAVGDRMVAATALGDEQRDGTTYARVQLRCRWLPLTAGVQAIDPVRVRYAYATRFREHLLRGREPVDRQDGEVRSEPRTLEVRRLVGDAPDDYTGAVGDFDVEVTSGGQQVHVGETFQVEMFVVGDGNLERFRKPQRVALDGFHVQGVVERERDGGRVFVFDVVALREGMTELAGLSLVSYAPEQRAFVRLGGEPVPVRVLPRREGVELAEGIEELIREDALRRDPGSWWLRWLFVGLAIGGLVVHRFGQTRRRRRRLDAGMNDLRLALGSGDAARSAAAFEALLARVGGGDTFAVPIVWESLHKRGVAPEGMIRLKELHAALDQARFGGPMPDPTDVLAAAETLRQAARP
ncbi:MAG: hypothetical protein ACE37K_01665 [Planctomycetota bacterium]